MPDIKVKCKCGETRIECFSNPEKEKRCRACVKAAKNSPNKKEQVIDTEQTDLTHSNWQGGKYAGSVFQRSGDENAVIACVAGKQKRFKFAEYANDKNKTKEEADKYRKTLSDELEETKNKYKVIFVKNKPKYLIVKLSKNYCTLVDYKYLDFIKNNNLFVSKGGREESKSYCRYQSDKNTLLFHRHVLGILDAGEKVLGDHINRYPLDNREANLRQCSHSVNNGNKSIVNSMEYTQSGDKFVGTICYRTNPAKPQITLTEKFNSMEQAKTWARNKVKELDLSYAEMSDEAKTLAKEFETIMTEHAGDYKWSDIDEIENWDVDNTKATQIDNKKETLSVVTSKKEIYNKFKSVNPDFEPGTDVLTADRKIHHLTHKQTEYKYCSGCDQWTGVSNYFANKQNYDGLDRRCKTCKTASSKKYKEGKADNEQPDKQPDEQPDKQPDELVEKIHVQQGGNEDNEEDDIIDPNKYYNKFVELVGKFDGIMLSECSDYVNAHHKLKVKCRYGHEFKICYNNLKKNRWCGLCSTRKMERYTKEIAETIIGKPFEKVRPEWLKNGKNNKMELDIYNDELKLAIEYNGIQHYKFEKFFHKTKEEFEARVIDDELKVKLCKKNNVDFIVIPYTEEPFKYLIERLLERNIPLVNLEKKISVDNECASKLERKVGENDGIILSDYMDLLDKENNVKLRCNKNHEWTTKIKNIHRGLWCPTCGLAQDDETKEKISKKMSEFFATKEGKKSKEQALAKRSETLRARKEETIANIQSKQCKGQCGQVKSIDNFCKKSASADGYQSWCKTCTNDKKKASRAVAQVEIDV